MTKLCSGQGNLDAADDDDTDDGTADDTADAATTDESNPYMSGDTIKMTYTVSKKTKQ